MPQLSDTVFVYCDPLVHGRETYNKVIDAVNKACADISNRTTGNGDSKLLFLITHEKDTNFQINFPNTVKGPQVIF